LQGNVQNAIFFVRKLIVNEFCPMDANIRSKRAKHLLPLLAAAVVAGGMVLYLTPRRAAHSPPTPRQPVVPAGALSAPFRDVLSAANAPDRHQAIQRFQQWLSSLPKDQAARAIRQILASRQDARTGQGFQLNADGSLRQAPTLRTLLLDMLGKLDPAQAAAAAKEILQQKDSADEWAVALALYARVNNTDDAVSFLKQKAEEMAGYRPWQENPSAGYLEAFDVFVYTGDTDFVPELSRFACNTENPALAHAAFLTLDRLAQNDPRDTLAALNDDPALLIGRDATKGGLFARADVRDPEQRALLADYLLSPDRSLPELEAFAGLFPNENFMISANLLTPCPTLSNAELLSRCQAAQQTVGQWLQDSQFASIRPQLQQIQGRLGRILNGTGH
jgi:hypothetical protein